MMNLFSYESFIMSQFNRFNILDDVGLFEFKIKN